MRKYNIRMAQRNKKFNENLFEEQNTSPEKSSEEVRSLSLKHFINEVKNKNKKNCIVFIQLYFYLDKKIATKMVDSFFIGLEQQGPNEVSSIDQLSNMEQNFSENLNNQILLTLIECFNVTGTMAIYMYYTMYKRWQKTSTL